MSSESNDNSCEHFVVCRPAEVCDVIDKVATLMRARAYRRHDVFGVELALEEAITNALTHGNCSDPSKTVRVQCRVDTNSVLIEIEDEGNGFCSGILRDPTAPENIDRPGGRGLLFIRSYMSEVKYNEVGNRVTMQKLRSESTTADTSVS